MIQGDMREMKEHCPLVPSVSMKAVIPTPAYVYQDQDTLEDSRQAFIPTYTHHQYASHPDCNKGLTP
jgi:hypothetical protein